MGRTFLYILFNIETAFLLHCVLLNIVTVIQILARNGNCRSVGLDVGLEKYVLGLGLQKKVLALALALKNFHVLGLGLDKKVLAS